MERLVIANCSAFFGDRFSAAAEMVRGGPIDVLTGDYLAELTLAILHKQRAKTGGWVPTFVKQMEQVLGECTEKKIKIVSNAGGLNPQGLAEELHELAADLGLKTKIAYIDGDDLIGRLDQLRAAGEPLAHLDKKTPLEGVQVLTANAYLGGFGIADALSRGADVVVTGRVTDAALVVGPAAWKFNWPRDGWDRLAGAVAAGHIIECGTQATGGNYSFFEEVHGWANIGFPIVEMHPDGSFVVTKHPGTGGVVSVGTVTAQLLYEIESPRYFNPDVTARFDTLRLTQEGPDRVRVEGVRGEPPPTTTKVCINTFGGYRNSMMVRVPEPHVERKRDLISDTLFEKLGGRERFAVTDVKLIRSDRPDPRHNDQAFAILKVTVMDPSEEKVGRAFSSTVVEMATAHVPGLSLMQPPDDATPYLVYWPALIDSKHIRQRVVLDDVERLVDAVPPAPPVEVRVVRPTLPRVTRGPSVHQYFGRLFGARSGDKGGNANLGVWARAPEQYSFLHSFLTVDKLKSLLHDLEPFEIDRHELPNLYALNFYIRGLLGDGVAASTRLDPQAKTLGEYLRAKMVDIPVAIL
jgi:hypothetical protein